MNLYIYILIIALVFLCALLTLIYASSSLIAMIIGAPYVATKQEEIDLILNQLKLTKKQTVLELGSGDGRFILSAVKKWHVNGLGIEIQPLLLFFSRLQAKMRGLYKAKFVSQNFFHTDFSPADVIFMFLMPKTLKRLRSKLLKECSKGTIIISHGFKIEDWEKYHYKTLDRKPYRTFFYKVT